MRACLKRMFSIVSILCSLQLADAQDLAPRAYIITPIHSNALTLTYSFNSGGLIFDGETPISDASAKVSVSVFNYSHSLRFFGRTASFLAALPYGIGNFHGTVMETETNAYRSGLLASAFAFL